MNKHFIRPPFFEVGPKAYFCGAARRWNSRGSQEEASQGRRRLPVIYTPQLTDLHLIAENTSGLYLCAQHMDPLYPGRGQGSILPEAVKAAGAKCVMLNHAERPVALDALARTIGGPGRSI